MDCLVKAIARRKVTQLKSSVSKALSSITTNTSQRHNSQSEQQQSTKHKLKMSINKNTKKLLSKLRKMITKGRFPVDTSKHTSISKGEEEEKVKTRFDFI